ncbi:hypothetical protein FSP39_006792 [Pinctada imbricata]|uniref:Uncharacterized protein n=1 Tax=Pinctada imbricata TaxID=66713 RepID=A0AA88XVN9_PINIB|nr:hypothetical protein FSP39_006792 [Pinctada imbricata]
MEAFYMKGTSESYAKYPPWQPCLNGSFELEFKTSQPSGLIMYTDDKGYYDFFELKLLRGSMQLILSLGTEKMRFLIERSLNDSHWHKVSINRSGRNVTLTVDNIPFPREYHSQDQEFGVAGDNSDVFIGGIPLSYRQKRDELTLKTVFQEPHYKGFIRNLLVSDCGRPKYRPPRLDSYDVLDDGMDKCLDPDTNPCQHGGICLTKDQHVQCDCSYTQFEGEFCEKESFQSEVTFHGVQYFFYDLSAGQDMHSTTRDKVDFYFRTQQKTGFLFYTGEMSDYIILALRNGWIVGVVNLGSEDAHLEINRPGYRFDDNQWHHLVLYRNTREIKYTANDVELDLTKMAADGADHMTIQGDITFDKCKEMVESQPITFTTSESFIRLPHWEVDHLGGTLTFSFQTNEQNGVIMYNSRVKNSDFFAFELWDGYLWFIIDLGSGPTKKRVTQNKVNDGVQHQVILEHLSNSGYIMLDGSRVEYLVSGQSLNLNLEGELYIGGVGDNKQKLPKDLWSGMLGYGYVGCLQDLTLNREKIDLLTVGQEDYEVGYFGHLPCDGATMFGSAMLQWRFAATLEFDGAQYMKVTLPDESQSEAEDISIRFKTTRSNGLIFVTSSDRTSDKMELYLEEGIVQLDVNINNQRQKFRQKQMSLSRTQVLNDGEWHTVKILRRGERIGFYLDNYSHQENHQPRDPQSLDLGQMSQDGNTMGRLTGFVGSMQQLVFNGNHYFEMADDEKTNKNIELTARFESDQPVFRDAVTFRSTDSYVILLQLNARLQFSIYFKFKTAEPDGLMLFNGGKGQDFIALELQSGYLHFIYNMGDGAERIVVNYYRPP